ncbi:hypothetical protein OAA06_01540 [bacterium]|nr:hypothetical protein [bacterium]
MASIKGLKKDINYLASEILTHGYLKQMMHEGIDEKALSAILVDAIKMRNDLVARINHPDGKENPKIVKTYFLEVRKQLMETTDALFSKINEL